MEPETSHVPTKLSANRLFVVTPFSKYFALVIFIALPIIFLYVGYTWAEGEINEATVGADVIVVHKNTIPTITISMATESIPEYYGYTLQLPTDVQWSESLETEGNYTRNGGYTFPGQKAVLKWPAVTYTANIYGDFNNSSSTNYQKVGTIESKLKTELMRQGFEFQYTGEKPYSRTHYYIKKDSTTARLANIVVSYVMGPSSNTKACDDADANPDAYPSFVWRNEWSECISQPLLTNFTVVLSSPLPLAKLPAGY